MIKIAPIYLDWMNPVSGECVLVGVYGSFKEAGDAIGESEDAVRKSWNRGYRMRCGVMAHHGLPRTKGVSEYLALEV